MAEYNFSVDEKHTVWLRTTTVVEANSKEEADQKMLEYIKKLHAEGDLSELYECGYETNTESLETMTVDENDGCATIEVMDEDYQTLWSNRNG